MLVIIIFAPISSCIRNKLLYDKWKKNGTYPYVKLIVIKMCTRSSNIELSLKKKDYYWCSKNFINTERCAIFFNFQVIIWIKLDLQTKCSNKHSF